MPDLTIVWSSAINTLFVSMQILFGLGKGGYKITNFYNIALKLLYIS